MWHLPKDAVLGQVETLYPEYRKKIKATYVPLEPCKRDCGACRRIVQCFQCDVLVSDDGHHEDTKARSVCTESLRGSSCLRDSQASSYFQLAIAFPCGEPGPNSNISILMPFGSVAFATDESSGRTRTSSTITPRSLSVATTFFRFSTCRPK